MKNRFNELRADLGVKFRTKRTRVDILADTLTWLAEVELEREDPRLNFRDALEDVIEFAIEDTTIDFARRLLDVYGERDKAQSLRYETNNLRIRQLIADIEKGMN